LDFLPIEAAAGLKKCRKMGVEQQQKGCQMAAYNGFTSE
jgi:hypothetical protein